MATDFAALGISVDTGDLKRAIKDLNSVDKQAGKTEKNVNRLSKSSDSLAKSTLNVNGAMKKLAATLSVLALVDKVRALVTFTDSMTLLDSRIKVSTNSTKEYNRAQKLLVDISIRTGSELKSNIILFTRINKSIVGMGGSVRETARFTETLVKSLTISGATASETTSVVRQMSQALASGVLRGDEFNSIVENGARVQQILADSLNVTKGELRNMAQTGQLTATKVIAAILSQSAIIDAEFKKLPVTVERALNNITTRFGVYILEVNKGVGATAGLADILNKFGDNIGPIIESMITLGNVTATVFAGRAISDLVAYTAKKKILTAKEIAHGAAIKENIAFDVEKATSNKRVAQSELRRTKTIISDIEANGLNTKSVQNSIKADLDKINSRIKLAKAEVSHTFAMGDSSAAFTAQTKAEKRLIDIDKEAILQKKILSTSIHAERGANLLLVESQTLVLAEKEALLLADAALIKANLALSETNVTLAKTLKEAGAMTVVLNTAMAVFIALEVGVWLGDTLSTTALLAIGLAALAGSFGAAAIAAGGFTGVLAEMLIVLAAHPIIAFAIGLTAVIAGITKYKEVTRDKNDFSFLPKAEAMKKSLELVESSSAELAKVRKVIEDIQSAGGTATEELITKFNELTAVQFRAGASAKVFGATTNDLKDAMTGNISIAKSFREVNEKQAKSIDDIIKGLEEQSIQLFFTERRYKEHQFALAGMTLTQQAYALSLWDTTRALIAQGEATKKFNSDIDAAIAKANTLLEKTKAKPVLTKDQALGQKKKALEDVVRLREKLAKLKDQSEGSKLTDGFASTLVQLTDQLNLAETAAKDADSALSGFKSTTKKATNTAKEQTKVYFEQASALERIKALLAEPDKVSFEPSGKPIAELNKRISLTKESIALAKDQNTQTAKIAREQADIANLSKDASKEEIAAANTALEISKDLADAMERSNKNIKEQKGFVKDLTGEINKQTEAAKKLRTVQSDTIRAFENLKSFSTFENIFPTISKESLRLLDKYANGTLPKSAKENKNLTKALEEQKAVWEEWSGIIQGTFSQLLSNGKSFTENLASMFDNMIDRMLNKALEFASNNIINGIFSGSFGQTALGAVVGAAAIGVSYLLSDSPPKRSDIAPSNTTVNGDSRALGFAEMVATDIAARDYIFARQLEAFNEMNTNLKLQTKVLTDTGILGQAKDYIAKISDSFGSALFDQLPTAAQGTLTGIGDVFKSVKDIFNPLTDAVNEGVDNLITGVLDSITGNVNSATFTNSLNTIGSDVATNISDALATGFQSTNFADVANKVLTPDFSSETGKALAGGTSASDASSSAGKLGAVASVIGAAYSVYGLIAGWSQLDTSGKIIGVISTVFGVISAAVTAAVAIAGAVATAAATGISTAVLAAVPIVGWVVAALINVYQSVLAFTEQGVAAGLSQLFTGGLGSLIADWVGFDIWSIFGPDKTPNSWFVTTRQSADPGFYVDPNFKNGDRVPGANPKLYAKTGNKDVRVGINTPFGQTVLSTHETGQSKQQGVDMFGDVLLAVYEIDTALADALNKADGVASGMGETLQFYDDWLSSGNRIAFKQNLEGLDIAQFLSQRYLKIVDVLGESGTATGVAFDAWVSLFKDKFGPENILGIIQNVSANFEGLSVLPLELVKLLDDNIKSFDLGGTPEDAVAEMNAIVTSYTLLSLGLDTLGATNISDVQIVEFLAKMNAFGFSVNEGAASILQYSQILALMGDDIGTGLSKLFAFADEQAFTAREFSNFFSTAGAFVSLGFSSGTTNTFDDLVILSGLVDDLATKNLDKAAVDKLAEQTSIYGKSKISIEEARKEIEDLGLATADAILELVNNFQFLQNVLVIFGSTIKNLAPTTLGAVKLSKDLVELFGGIEEAAKAFDTVSKGFFSPIDQVDALITNLSRSSTVLTSALGVGEVTFDNYLEVLGKQPSLTAEQIKAWLDAGAVLSQLNDLEAQRTDLLKENTLKILNKQLELMTAQGKAEEVLTTQRQLEIDAMDEALRPMQAQINAENDLADVRQRAISLAEKQLSLDEQLLRLQGKDAEATKLSQANAIKDIEKQRTADIAALKQSQTSGAASTDQLNAAFAKADSNPISVEYATSLLGFIEDKSLNTVEEIFNAATTYGKDVFEIGQAIGLKNSGALGRIAESRTATDRLNAEFKAADSRSITDDAKKSITDYIEKEGLTTIKQIYKAATTLGVDVFDVGKSFGLNAADTAKSLTDAGIGGFSVISEAQIRSQGGGIDAAATAKFITDAGIVGFSAPDNSANNANDLASINTEYDRLISTQKQIFELQGQSKNDTNNQVDNSLRDAIASERKGLQDQIDELTLSYIEKLNKQRDALYEVNRPLFDQLQILQVAKQQHELDIQLLQALGKNEEALAITRKDQLDGMDASLHATQIAIFVAQDAAKIESERVSLQDQLNTITDTASQALSRQRDALDGSNVALFDQIQLAKEQKTIDEERKGLLSSLDDLTLNFSKSLAKQRDAIDSSNRSLFDQINSIKIANKQHELDIQLLEALGKTEEALTIKRQDQLDAMAPSLKATQEAIWAAQDATKAEQDLTTARQEALNKAKQATTDAFSILQKAVSAEKERLKDQYDTQLKAAKDNVDTLTKSVSKLTQLSDSLKSTLDSLSPVGEDKSIKRQAAQAELKTALAIVKAGGGLPDNLDSALSVIKEPSEGLFKTFVEYQRDFFTTANDIKGLSTIADEQKSKAVSQLDVAKTQLSVIEKGYQDELTRLDVILSTAQSQIDAINGTTVAVISISEAINNLSAAISAQALAQVAVKSPSLSRAQAVAVGQSYATIGGGKRDETLSSGTIIPGFALGGIHSGGLRLVGENGPELEYTGPSQIINSGQTSNLLSNDELIAEIKQLRKEVVMLRQENRAGQAQIAANTGKSTRILKAVTQDGTSISTTAAV